MRTARPQETKPRRRLRKLKTKFHTKRAVIRIVPIRASNAAFLSVMVGVWTLVVSAATPEGLFDRAGHHHLAQVQSTMSTFLGVHLIGGES